jgi:ketosteroid isomerase-like protein
MVIINHFIITQLKQLSNLQPITITHNSLLKTHHLFHHFKMKKTFYLLLVLLGISMGTQAQSSKAQSPKAKSTQTQSNDKKQVEAAVEALKTAMVSGNRSQLQAIASPNLTYGHSSGLMEDKAAFVEALASGKSDFVSIELTDQTIKLDGDIALVRHNLSAQTNNNGTPGSTKLGVLLVWKKQQGKWKLLARQAFKL